MYESGISKESGAGRIWVNIEPEDVRELVNAVEWMYENEAERNDMGNRARKIAEDSSTERYPMGK